MSKDQSASRNWLPFNINHAVRVKLTQRGLDVLKAKHDALYEWSQSVKGPLRPWEPPTLKDGWYETQLWCLMNDFGDETRMGLDPCFETTIELTAPLSERGRWIPVSERLPALDGPDILIAGRNDGVRIWQASPYGPNDPSWIERYAVTHWADMSIVPLPDER